MYATRSPARDAERLQRRRPAVAAVEELRVGQRRSPSTTASRSRTEPPRAAHELERSERSFHGRTTGLARLRRREVLRIPNVGPVGTEHGTRCGPTASEQGSMWRISKIFSTAKRFPAMMQDKYETYASRGPSRPASEIAAERREQIAADLAAIQERKDRDLIQQTAMESSPETRVSLWEAPSRPRLAAQSAAPPAPVRRRQHWLGDRAGAGRAESPGEAPRDLTRRVNSCLSGESRGRRESADLGFDELRETQCAQVLEVGAHDLQADRCSGRGKSTGRKNGGRASRPASPAKVWRSAGSTACSRRRRAACGHRSNCHRAQRRWYCTRVTAARRNP